jgi:hypothetical protein
MTSRTRSVLALCALAVIILAQGCITAVAVGGLAAGGASAAAYKRGWYRAGIQAPHYQVDQALRRMCRRARLIERKRTCDGYSSNYLYQDLRDVKVKFKLKSSSPENTTIYIRVGFWGDKATSGELFQALQEDLGALPAK